MRAPGLFWNRARTALSSGREHRRECVIPTARKVVSSFQARQASIPQKANLSPREREVLECLAQGRAYKQISDQLGVSIDTIRTYIRRIYEKLHVCSRTEAVAKYLRP